MVFLDFEKPLESLFEKLEKIKQVGEDGDIDVTEMVKEIETKIKNTQKTIYDNLSGWQKVQLSRHPVRPYSLYYIEQMSKSFIELHGDRTFKDDKAIVGGLANIDGQSVVIIGHQKGVNTKMRQFRNFGMANPEGYRKALRLMKLRLGGAHTEPEAMAKILKKHIKKELAELSDMTPQKRIDKRIKKYSKIGQFDRVKTNLSQS